MKPLLSDSLTLAPAGGAFVNAFGGRYYRIANVDELPPFLMNVVSSSELWLFLASNGGLTAGRGNAEHALFPYQTVDRIYDSAGSIGPFTAIRVSVNHEEVLWEPFARHTPFTQAVNRNLYKSVEGDRVWFEEINRALGLAFRYGWSTADEHGFIRRCELENLTGAPLSLRLIDGMRHLLPPGIPSRLQSDSSCLADAYKTAELVPGTSLAVFALAAAIVDRAVPMESLRASAVWSEGLPGADVLLSDAQVRPFLAGGHVAAETRRRGIRSTYAIAARITLPAHGTQSWMMVADTDLTQSEAVRRSLELAKGGWSQTVAQAADRATEKLRALVAAADGLQAGAQESTTAHHFANVLFNIMRGGIFAEGYAIPTADFASFARTRHHAVAARHTQLLAGLPETVARADFLERLAAGEDPELTRLGLEYLPLIFSRRHGDPSRPWNRFNIRLRDAAGQRVLHHEGNWRDIFQNWEALCVSFPDFLESVVAKFVNASTLDGYNPYRLSQDGVDWEVPEHDNPWSSIGYWGDHQTIYLLKLLEWSERYHPGLLANWLRRDLFTYADVPYRIAPYAAMRRNPHVTIDFDAAKHRAIMERVAQVGTDGRLVCTRHGDVLHVTLAEKLLLLVLTRLTNFVPGGGIWMNTQRPEWNDANNALVGYGVSMVTLCYTRRMLAHLQRHVLPALGDAPLALSAPLAALAHEVSKALQLHGQLLDTPKIDDARRRALLDALAEAGSRYRDSVYGTVPAARAPLSPDDLGRLLGIALAFLDHTIAANARPDGLYHAYNLLEFCENPATLAIHHLGPMLEGQVAVLSSGALKPAESVTLLRALRQSALYRADQNSYVLYPDRELPSYLERSVIPPSRVTAVPLLRELTAAGDRRLVDQDVNGTCRFAAELVNGDALHARLREIAKDPRWAAAVAADEAAVKAAYEAVFHHRAFTGRSGSMFGYEGLGCIYWHMVAKLLLAVQENLRTAEGAGDASARALAEIYHEVRDGLGFNKTPAQYGAFPMDPYSHTPGHAGAQQPGMTGQVKEEILTRFGELGVCVEQVTVRFTPALLRHDEFTKTARAFSYLDVQGRPAELPLPAGALAFTFCGVPIVYRLGGDGPELQVASSDGRTRVCPGSTLPPELASGLFRRDGGITAITVLLGAAFRPFAR